MARKRIFISHVSEDKIWLYGLVRNLLSYGHSVFLDRPKEARVENLQNVHKLDPGKNWRETLNDGLSDADWVLVIWSLRAREKLAGGRGIDYAREIAWASLNNKLVVGVANTQMPPKRGFFGKAELTREDDEAYRIGQGLDPNLYNFDPIFDLLKGDKDFGPHANDVRTIFSETQSERIEGLRKTQEYLPSEGLDTLNTDRFTKVAEVSRETFDATHFVPAFYNIDRATQEVLLRDIANRSLREPHPAVALDGSPECSHHYLINRLDLSAFDKVDLPWARGLAEDYEQRISDNLTRINNAISDRRQSVLDGVPQARPVLVVSEHSFDSSDDDEVVETEDVISEWRETISWVEPTPGFAVNFVMSLEDEAFFDRSSALMLAENCQAIELGAVPKNELRKWCRNPVLMKRLAEKNMQQVPTGEGRPKRTELWLREKLRAALEGGEESLTMLQAEKLASDLLYEAYQRSHGDGASSNLSRRPDGTPTPSAF